MRRLTIALVLVATALQAGCRLGADNTSQGKVVLEPVYPGLLDGSNPCGPCAK